MSNLSKSLKVLWLQERFQKNGRQELQSPFLLEHRRYLECNLLKYRTDESYDGTNALGMGSTITQAQNPREQAN